MFKRAREALRRAFRRFVDSLRRSVRGVEVRSLSCRLDAPATNLDFLFSQPVHTAAIEPPEPAIRSEEIDCEVVELQARIEAELAEDSEPPVPETEVRSVDAALAGIEIKGKQTRLPSAEVREESVLEGVGQVRGISAVRPDAGLRGIRDLGFADSTRTGDATGKAAALPLVRSASNFYKFSPEQRVRIWKELLDQVGKGPKQLELIGIFPGVPVRGIKRIGLQAGSSKLRLWLDTSIKRSDKTPTRTLILARERGSGALHRVFDRAG